MIPRPPPREHPCVKDLDRRIEEAACVVADRSRVVGEIQKASNIYALLVRKRAELLLRLALDPASGDDLVPESALLRAARAAAPERPWRDEPRRDGPSTQEQITDEVVYVTVRRTSRSQKYAVRACSGGFVAVHRDLGQALAIHARDLAKRRGMTALSADLRGTKG